MNRFPIRIRIAVASAAAMLVLLVCAGVVVHVRLRIDLDDRIDDALRARSERVGAQLGRQPLAELGSGDPEETLIQVLAPDGALLDSVGGEPRPVTVPALTRSQAMIAARRALVVETQLTGLDGRVRVYARPGGAAAPDRVVVVARSLVDRDEALASVVRSFAAGGALAVLLTGVSGYLIGRTGLAPVEAMRRRAREVSLAPTGGDLPLPVADDEVRRLGETLNEMLARLRESFARESRFVADASHELRTPVAVIKTELEAALLSGDHGPVTREGLVAALEECDRLGQLAEDLLVLARTSDGSLPIRGAVLPVLPVALGVAVRFEARAGERGRVITVIGVAGCAARAWFDPDRVRQALSNLVDNALRHGAGEVRIEVRPGGTGVVIEVRDDGDGFAEAFAPRAFQRFSRGDAARSGAGAGLGLAIVETVAAAHGGHVAIGTGPGAVVRLWLPGAEPTRPDARDSHG